ncbi:MAG: hypothetical protein CSYNP_01696 [Syntrophus sp. SKADARSKE-3]|nr:hypothetical protein [Syntrophus sp. SKADARSKE-3]
MAKMSFGSKGGKVRSMVRQTPAAGLRSPEEVVRDMKRDQQKPPGEDYRERSLAIHGLICARCGKEFSGVKRQLLTVHHKDGNHFNNPPDGSNWENLCVYCHEDAHSREILGEYYAGSGGKEVGLAYKDEASNGSTGFGSLGDLLKKFPVKK